MDNRANHHKKLDELLKDSGETLHKMIDTLYDKGVVIDSLKEDNYLLPKLVMLLWMAEKPYNPPTEQTIDNCQALEYKLWGK